MSTEPVTLERELAHWRTTNDARAFKTVAKRSTKKSTLGDWLKTVKENLDPTRPDGVHAGRDRIHALVNEIDAATLSAAERQQLESIAGRADQALSNFDTTWPGYKQEVTAAASRLKGLNALRIAGQVVVILIGVICIPSPAWWFGLLLIVGAIAASSVLKARFTKEAWDLYGVANRPVRIANGLLGGPPRGRLDASGLYAEVDLIWLTQLSTARRDVEFQQRAAVKAEASGNRTQAASSADYAWLEDPRIKNELNEIFMNIGGSQRDTLDRNVVLNALKRELPSYATVDEALPVLRDIVERQWNKFGDNGQTRGTINASERVLYDDEQ